MLVVNRILAIWYVGIPWPYSFLNGNVDILISIIDHRRAHLYHPKARSIIFKKDYYLFTGLP